ncbi:MAG TPA: hypothetical protein VF285_12830 [Castellaniella sp.]|uniref:hypothetical protein n=1 Tax=Castellaniella sp. TaxID=1955812 RepID=UPI002EE48ADF
MPATLQLTLIFGVYAVSMWIFLTAAAVPALIVARLLQGLATGIGLTLGSIAVGSDLLLFVGTVLAGTGFGLGFLGALRTSRTAHSRTSGENLVWLAMTHSSKVWSLPRTRCDPSWAF